MSQKESIRVLMICAHPDEPDMYAGGLAALYAEQGHRVKFLSLTNGDSGHYALPKKELAVKRKGEADEAARRLGIDEYAILGTSDGELEANIETRKEVVRQIRLFNPDVLVAFHPDGSNSPDNRYAGKVVSDAVPYAGLPGFLPEVPSTKKKLLVLLMPDMSLQATYRPDVAIDIDSVIEKKLLACDAHSTTFYELVPWFKGTLGTLPSDWEGRRRYLLEGWPSFYASAKVRPALEARYGQARANQVQFAESFEIAKYGFQPNPEQLKALLPVQ